MEVEAGRKYGGRVHMEINGDSFVHIQRVQL